MATPDQTLEALKLALAAALPGRLVTRDFRPLSVRSSADLERGIVTVINRGEHGYANTLGREAQLGRLQVILVGQLKVSDREPPGAVEKAELALAEEIKTFLQGVFPLPVRDCTAEGFAQSGQIEAPMGWVVFELEVMSG